MAAKNYTEILALVNAGNQMGLSNTIKRDYGIPLDFTSVQPSYDDAVIYAAENTKAYVGQPLSVGGKLYIINDVAAETKHTVGEKEYDNYLVEVGSATEGDGVTIDLEEGVLTLHGFESALTGYLPRKAEDGTLEWVPISAVVQGDGNKVTTLTSTDGSVEITKTTDTDESLVYDLKVTHPAAPEYAVAADERAEGATSTTYHLTKDGTNVDVAIVVPDAYNDTALAARVKAIEDDYLTEDDKYDDTELANRVKAIEDDYLKEADKYDDTALAARVKALEDEERYDDTELAGRVTTIETAINNTETGLAAHEDRISAMETFWATTEDSDNVVNTLKEIQEYIKSDESGAATMAGNIQANTAAIEKLNGDVNTEGSVAKAIEDAVAPVRTLADAAQTAQEVSDAIDAKIAAENLGQYAKSADVVSNTAFAEFQETNTAAIGAARTGAVEDVEAKGYAVATEVADTYATKQSVTDLGNTITTTLNDYAKTADVNAELAKKIETGSIVHSSESFAEGVTVEGTKLNIVVDAYTKQEVRDYVADVIEDMTGGESAADVLLALNNHIATYEEKVGQIDAKDAAQDIAIATADGKGAQGIADAAAAKSVADAAKAQAETNKTDIAGHLTRIGVLETAKGDHETRISTAEGQIAALLAEDQAINKTIGEHAGSITALQGEDSRLAGLISANTTEIGKKANAADVYTKGEVDTKVQEAIDAIPEVDFTPYLKSEDAAKTYATIAALEGIYKAGEGETAATGVLAEEIARAKAAEQKIADDLALLIENPTEALDSVKELIAHVQAHGTAVEGIIDRLDGHDTAIAGLGDRVTALESKPDYVLPAATKDTLGGVKLSDEIGANEAGQLEVKEVSTDKLVNGISELILNGGNASGAASN